MHATKKVEDLMNKDAKIKHDIEIISDKIQTD